MASATCDAAFVIPLQPLRSKLEACSTGSEALEEAWTGMGGMADTR